MCSLYLTIPSKPYETVTIEIDPDPIKFRAAAFYTGLLNFAPSDELRLGGKDGPTVGAFLHLDRGEEWVDHRELMGED